MIAIVDKTEIKDALRVLTSVKAKAGETCLRITTCQKSGITLARIADKVNVAVTIPAYVEQEGDTYVNIKDFADAMQLCKRIARIDDNGNKLHFKFDDGNDFGGSEFDIIFAKPQYHEYRPETNPIDNTNFNTLTIPRVVFKQCFSEIEPCMKKLSDSLRPFTCLFELKRIGKILRFGTSDTFRLACVYTGEISSESEFACTLPYNAGLLAKKSSPKQGDIMAISYSGNLVCVEFDNVRIDVDINKIVSQENFVYPDFDKPLDLYNRPDLKKFTIPCQYILPELKNIKPVLKKVDLHPLRLNFEKNSLRLVVDEKDVPNFETAVKIPYEDQPASVRVNVEKLLEMLEPIKDRNVTFKTCPESFGALVLEADSDQYVAVLMGIKGPKK